MLKTDTLFTIKEASEWATQYLSKTVTTANISYLIQYGRVKKIGDNGMSQVSQQELMTYYKILNSPPFKDVILEISRELYAVRPSTPFRMPP